MYFDEKVNDVFKRLNTSQEGLSEKEAQERLKKYGPNELVKKKGDGPLKIFIRQFNSFIIYILIGAVIVSTAVAFYEHGDFIDSIAILVILILNAVLGFVQEYNAEKSIEALRKMASLKARVMRGGKEVEIEVKNLVPGDLLILSTGEKIPADARVIEAVQLHTEEAALTGESTGEEKQTKPLDIKTVLADRTNMIFSGTTIVDGRGQAIVTGTGMDSEIGKIAHLIQTTKKELTPLQKNLERLGKKIGLIVIAVCVVVFLTGILSGGEILSMFMAAVSLAVAAVPEGLAAVVTITLALGIQKMVKRNALIRKLPSVETLGSTSVICSDKTGTLTHNQMTVKKVYVNNQIIDVTGSGYNPEGEFSKPIKDNLIFEIGVLCNDSELVHEDKLWQVHGDPTEGCLLTSAAKAHISIHELREDYPRINELMFDSVRKRMTTVHNINGPTAYVKGAPDSVLGVCDRVLVNGKVKILTKDEKANIMKINDQFADQALRVLAFAYKPISKNDKVSKKTTESDLIFVGLQAMIDPPRQEVKDAVAKCKSAGIKVVMITGDYLKTAVAIGRAIGIEGKAIGGEELDLINLDKDVESIGIYARVNPKDKMKIVEALKKNSHVVAMTGDGVNDAPALKRADIGIAMGITGTDVSKEASDMILTDDNFTSIVNAVEEGRGIFDNIRKFVNYLLSSNLAEVLVLFTAMILAGIFGFTDPSTGAILLPLLPLHILWMNLITDGPPALALGLDPHSKNIMGRPPRHVKEPIINRKIFINIIIVGILMTIATLLMFNYTLNTFGHNVAMTVTLTMLVLLQFVRIEIVREDYNIKFFSNKWLTLALGVSICLQLLIIYIPFLNNIFKTAPIAPLIWLYMVGSIIAVYIAQKIVSKIVGSIIRT